MSAPAAPSTCPVHMCNPGTGQTLPARLSGLCERHEGKLSRPLLQQLLYAQGDAERDASSELRAAVEEARRSDPHWAAWALRHEGRIELFEEARAVFARALALTGARPAYTGRLGYEVEQGTSPVAIKNCTSGDRVQLVELAGLLGPMVEHVVVVPGEGVVARSQTLPELMPKLSSAVVRQAADQAGELWIQNGWTKKKMTAIEAAVLLRGTR